MSADGSDSFQPPTPEQVSDHLASHPATGPSAWTARLPMMGLLLLAVAVFLVQNAATLLLIWAAMGGLFIFMLMRARRAKALEGRVAKAGELAMLRHEREALRLGWRLLPELTVAPPLYQRCLALLAHCLDQVRAYESAMVVYDRLLDSIPGGGAGGPGALQLRLQRAMAALACDHLTDADDALRSLRGQMDPGSTPPPIVAAYHLATLVQDVRTHHFGDAIDRSPRLMDDLRPLGVEAGFGHALMALCYQQMAEKPAPDVDDASSEPEASQDYPGAAAAWWSRATLLIPASALVYRFPELGKVREAIDG